MAKHRKSKRCKVVHIKGQGRRRICHGKNGKITSNTKAR